MSQLTFFLPICYIISLQPPGIAFGQHCWLAVQRAGWVNVEQNILPRDRKKRRQSAALLCTGQWFSTLAAQKNHLESFLQIKYLVPHPAEILI